MKAIPAAADASPSSVDHIVWPPLHTGETARLAALAFQLEQSQWLPAAVIAGRQREQLVQVVAHAHRHCAHFRGRMQAAGLQPEALIAPAALQRLSVMGRRDVQAAGAAIYCTQLPRAHAPVSESRTSGSSGEPVVVKRTEINRLMWLALTLREHLWQGRDFRGTLAVIRANLQGDETEWPTWGPPASLLFQTGASHGLAISTDLARQVEWLLALDPDYLLVYPTNLAALLDRFEAMGRRLPRLRQIRTIGETLSPGTRDAARRVLGAGIADTYSSEEVGVIAVQCPESGLYHTMAESLIVEVLDERGEPCAPGEVGRVVITDLHNFATPLIRYDLGDYAEAADTCSCGRGLPALQRIIGRERNMVRLPDGRSFWPLVGFARYRHIAPIRQYQLIQREREVIEVRLVSDAPLTMEQERRLGDVIRESLGFPFRLQFFYFPEKIPRGPGGKFEEFVCLIA